MGLSREFRSRAAKSGTIAGDLKEEKIGRDLDCRIVYQGMHAYIENYRDLAHGIWSGSRTKQEEYMNKTHTRR